MNNFEDYRSGFGVVNDHNPGKLLQPVAEAKHDGALRAGIILIATNCNVNSSFPGTSQARAETNSLHSILRCIRISSVVFALRVRYRMNGRTFARRSFGL